MSIDPKDYRKIMGNFATGVTVVTTNNGGRLHGFTANSITSVSLDPLLMLVCVGKSANAHQQMQEATHFGVSILAAEQLALSDLFAVSAEPQVGSLRGADYRLGSSGAPLLEGALAWLECRSAYSVEAGDHTIFLGEIVDGGVLGQGPALLYFRGGYRELDD